MHNPQTQTKCGDGQREGGRGQVEADKVGEMGTSVKMSTIQINFKKFDMPIINKQPNK